MLTITNGIRSRASLEIYNPPKDSATDEPGRLKDFILFHFNPNRIRMSKGVSWNRIKSSSVPGTSRPELKGGEPRRIGFEMFLDANILHSDLESQVKKLLGCCKPSSGSLPWIKLRWGSEKNSINFYSVITHLDVTYTLFSVFGNPLRASCNIELEETGGTPPKQNPTSGSPGGLGAHETVAGESLASVAWEHYGDPAWWRVIARSNDLDDPGRLPPGTRLVLPRLDELSGAEYEQ